MIDYFALALTHALILIGVLRIVARPNLDREPAVSDEVEESVLPSTPPRSARASRSVRRNRAAPGGTDA